MATATKPVLKRPTEAFPGPRAFKPEEEKLFYGRERETSQLLDLLLTYQNVLLYAPSGAGKTSLIHAGLASQLKGENNCVIGRAGGEATPENDSDKDFNIFEYNLVASTVQDPTKVPLAPELKKYFKPANGKTTFLIIDQLEDVFSTYPERWGNRLPFFTHLAELLKAEPLKADANPSDNKLTLVPPLGSVHLLLVIREEFVPSLEYYSDLFPNQLRIRYHLQGLREGQAKKAIIGPLSACGLAIEEETVGKLVDNLRTIPVKTATGRKKNIRGEFVEPLHLQIVCQSLMARLPTGATQVTEDDISALADVDQTLSGFYERVLRSAVEECQVDEARVRSWFDKALITPGGTRGLVRQGEHETEGLANEVVAKLERESMIRPERRGSDLWYELTHDRFIAPIREANAQWLRKMRQRVWPDKELEGWLRFKAVEILDNRALAHHAKISKEEIVNRYLATLTQDEANHLRREDWRQAHLYFANDVIDGKFELISSLGPDSYHRVEGDEGEMWLREVKALKAYLIWEARKANGGCVDSVGDYWRACEQIDAYLINAERKHPEEAFTPIRKYIEENFFSNGKLSWRKERRTKSWSAIKAQRLLALGIDCDADFFMRNFYGHIAKAVAGEREQQKASTKCVLQALGRYKGFEGYEAIVNCFEMAVAICFLDPVLIQEVLANP